MSIKFDTTSLVKGTQRALDAIQRAALQGVNDVASEVLRLSSFEVPHDTGLLQNSSSVQPDSSSTVIVGFNTVYAARLHEHPEYRFQKGRKGKYLEDPIKNNLPKLKVYIENAVKTALS